MLCLDQIGVTTVTNISANRGTIRAQTPPISTVTTGFVRGAIPPRTPSPAGTVIPGSATTWMSGNQPVQLIRASIGHSPRTRIVSQTIPAVSAAVSSATNISANIVSSQSVSQSQAPSSVAIQTVSSNSAASNIVSQPQTFVAVASTLATVLPPRQQTATLVYSNPQQFGASGPGQRLAVANPITAQRQVRPIQISNTRLPASGLGVRVSNGNISIRGPNNIPVLAPSSVLTTLPSGTSTTVTASNITAVTGLPAARIIQVQQPNTGGTAQVLSTGRITGNLMTLHPLVMNASAANTSNVRGTSTTTKPSLTITHVGKVTTPSSSISQQGNVQLTTTNLSQGTTITAAMPTSSSGGINQQQSQQQQSNSATTTPIGIVMGTNVSQTGAQPHQIAQIVNLNQSGINVGHGHQIVSRLFFVLTQCRVTYSFFTFVQQIIGSQSHTPITSRTNTSVATMPASSAHIVRMATTTSNTTSNSATVLPIAKVLPQQQQSVNEHSSIVTVSSVGNAQNVYIHSRSPSNPPTASSMATSTIVNPQTGSIISAPSGTYYMPVSSSSTSGNASIAISTAAVQTVTTNSSTIATSIPLNTTSLSASYAPQSGSFAVVTSSNRNTSSAATTSSQSIPVRFNPSVVVDANAHSVQGAIISMQQPIVHSNQQQVQKSSHVLIPASGTKAVMVTASPRTQNVIATASRKRDQYGEFVPSSSTSSNQIPLTKNAVKNLNTALASLSEQQASQQRPKSPVSRPGSSDGSTTVSANSSPGVDRQEEEALALNALHRNNRNISDGAQFATSQTVNVPQMQANNSAYANSGHIMNAFRPQPTLATVQPKPLQPTDRTATTSRNGNIDELTPRKRARKQQLSEYSNASIAKRYPNSSPATGFGIDSTVDSEDVTFANKHTADASSLTSENEAISKGIDTMENASNAANDSANKTVDFVIKKPKTCALIDVSRAFILSLIG